LYNNGECKEVCENGKKKREEDKKKGNATSASSLKRIPFPEPAKRRIR
jgi:hypothetical protein